MAPQHIVRSFDDELKGLSQIVTRMGGLAETQLATAIEALTRRDTALAEQVVLGDAAIDALEEELAERGATEDLFTNPRDERTLGYITGRFG